MRHSIWPQQCKRSRNQQDKKWKWKWAVRLLRQIIYGWGHFHNRHNDPMRTDPLNTCWTMVWTFIVHFACCCFMFVVFECFKCVFFLLFYGYELALLSRRTRYIFTNIRGERKKKHTHNTYGEIREKQPKKVYVNNKKKRRKKPSQQYEVGRKQCTGLVWFSCVWKVCWCVCVCVERSKKITLLKW